MFTLAVSCLTMSNLPCFMDLTFQVPIQYCALQHQTPDTEHCLCFGPATSFFLELLVIALQSSPGAYWTPTNLGGSSSGVISFCLFILFLGFSWQEYWSGLLFPLPEDHILSKLFTMTHPSWVALHGMAHSFTELCKALCHDKAVVCEEVLRLRALSNLHKVTY